MSEGDNVGANTGQSWPVSVVPLQKPAALRDLAHERRWVEWRQEGGKKPYKPGTNFTVAARVGDPAILDDHGKPLGDPATFGILAECTPGHDVGIVLGKPAGCEYMVHGIDLDAVLDANTEKLRPLVKEIEDAFDSYTEISPSETGLKIFTLGLPDVEWRKAHLTGLVINGKRPQIAVFLRHRFFAVTWKKREGGTDLIREPAKSAAGIALHQHMEKLRKGSRPRGTGNKDRTVIEPDDGPIRERASQLVERYLDDLSKRTAGRNDALFKCAAWFGAMVREGLLDEEAAWAGLFDASKRNGYEAKDGRSAVRDTIRSGLRRGRRQGRLPDELRKQREFSRLPSDGDKPGKIVANKSA